MQPDDLFGLKRSAIDGLRRTLRPVKAHAFGWIVVARLHADMLDAAAEAAAAARGGELGEARLAAAVLGPRFDGKAIDAFTERVRLRALRARSAVEGTAFTQYFTTEREFCEQQRAAALADFDESRVPAGLRPLVPLARQLGVGDDACRGWFVQKLPARERRVAKAAIAEHADAIDAWVATWESRTRRRPRRSSGCACLGKNCRAAGRPAVSVCSCFPSAAGSSRTSSRRWLHPRPGHPDSPTCSGCRRRSG